MSEDGTWYKDGLKFSCTQCGDCCTGDPGVVWVYDEDIKAIAEYLDKPVGEIRLMNTRQVGNRLSLTEFQNGDCIYFDPKTRGCQIYPVRPTQCRTWPFWRSNLESREAWDEACKGCPGAGTGQSFTQLEIDERAAKEDV
ncbi:MAG: YkgJ family cysteine cluster protein [Planctomycetaceae bacterium]